MLPKVYPSADLIRFSENKGRDMRSMNRKDCLMTAFAQALSLKNFRVEE